MIVAGIGFRSGIDAEEITALVAEALTLSGLHHDRLDRIATAASRADEPGFREAARRLGVAASSVNEDAMRRAAPAVQTRSARVLARHGVGSVAEAAALGCAGEGAELILARIASARATCALARGARS